jgi:7-cyano-7-deazaguanine synthase
MTQDRAIVLMSGGLDSSVLAFLLASQGWDVKGLSIDYGQKHRRELEAVERFSVAAGIERQTVTIGGFAGLTPNSSQTNPEVVVPHGHYAAASMRTTVVPNRNMTMLAIAAAYALGVKATRIGIAAHAGDHTVYPDCRSEFLSVFLEAVKAGNWDAASLELATPFVTKTKADIVRIGHDLGAPLHLTYSCYEGREKHCGLCGTCTERKEAFVDACVVDPTEYEV